MENKVGVAGNMPSEQAKCETVTPASVSRLNLLFAEKVTRRVVILLPVYWPPVSFMQKRSSTALLGLGWELENLG